MDDYDLYQRDYGVPIELNCGRDITSGTAFFMIIKRPKGTANDYTYSKVVAGTSGTKLTKITYSLTTSNLPILGAYNIRPEITFANRKQQGDWATFTVGTSWYVP